MEITELKNIIYKMKILLGGLMRRLNSAEKNFSELEIKSVETM